MSEKLCVFCVYLQYNAAGNGEYADPASLECGKDHQLDGKSYGQFVYDVEGFRKMILTAAKCPDYTQVEVKREANK